MRHEVHGVVIQTRDPFEILIPYHGDAPTTLTVEVAEAACPSDLTSDVLYEVAEAGRARWTVARLEQLVFRVHPIVDVFLEGHHARCVPHPGVARGAVEQAFIDVVLPRFLHLLGHPCLHAAAMVWPESGATAIVAPTGAGKSTLCAAMTEAGAQFLSDDTIAPTVEQDGVPFIPPAYPALRLWSDSATAIFGRDDFPLAGRRDKRRVRRETHVATALRALVSLDPDGASPPRLTRMTSTETMSLLAASVLRLVPDDQTAMTSEFRLLSSIVGSVPGWRLRFRHDYDQLPTLVELLRGLGRR